MKSIMFLFLFLSLQIAAQDIPVSAELALEQITDATDTEIEDDSWLQELEQYRKKPLNLNVAEKEEILSLKIVNALQADHLIRYREQLGLLVSIYELQAVPYWDILTIKKILPFISVSIPVQVVDRVEESFKKGQHQVLLRVGRTLELAKGFKESSSGSGYTGSPLRVFFRYRFQSGNSMQWGIVGEKDAGEQFLKGKQRAGFDFYSVHVFLRKVGKIQALAMGDFTVNMGQGLIHWQGMAFKKSADIIHIKRESAVLRPYSSAGEFPFHRGIGVTIRKGNLDITGFLSTRKLDGNLSVNETGKAIISSIGTSGYHRSIKEQDDKGRVKQFTYGMDAGYRKNNLKIGLRGVLTRFDKPVQKRDEPYNKYIWSGESWVNAGMDYSYTFRNLHVFGEIAIDKRGNKGIIHGMLISLSPATDLSIVYRSMSKFQSVYGNAFTENTSPSNERGLFAGIEIRPVQRVRITAYADVFVFPWLKYLVDAPTAGKEFLIQLVYSPNRLVEWNMRFRMESKHRNAENNTLATSSVNLYERQSWRMQFSTKLNASFIIRQRTELLWYKEGANPGQGFLLFSDIIYRPPLKPFSAVLRIAYFETSDYDSRVYAYEHDVMYSFSIPALSGKGFRYYATVGYDFNRDWTAWIRVSRSGFLDQETVGSGQDEIAGSKKSEIKCQVRWQF